MSLSKKTKAGKSSAREKTSSKKKYARKKNHRVKHLAFYYPLGEKEHGKLLDKGVIDVNDKVRKHPLRLDEFSVKNSIDKGKVDKFLKGTAGSNYMLFKIIRAHCGLMPKNAEHKGKVGLLTDTNNFKDCLLYELGTRCTHGEECQFKSQYVIERVTDEKLIENYSLLKRYKKIIDKIRKELAKDSWLAKRIKSQNFLFKDDQIEKTLKFWTKVGIPACVHSHTKQNARLKEDFSILEVSDGSDYDEEELRGDYDSSEEDEEDEEDEKVPAKTD